MGNDFIFPGEKVDIYEQIFSLAAPGRRTHERRASQLYVRAVWLRPAEHGHSVRRLDCQYFLLPVPGSDRADDFPCAELCTDVLGHLSGTFPEYLQAVSGEPEVSSDFRSSEGPEQPLFQLSQVPSDRPGSPGEGKDLHHLPQMQGEVHPKDLNSIIFREPPQVPGFLFSAGNFLFCLLTHICPFQEHIIFMNFHISAFLPSFLQKNIPFSENFCLHFLNGMVYCFQFAFKGRTGVLKHS